MRTSLAPGLAHGLWLVPCLLALVACRGEEVEALDAGGVQESGVSDGAEDGAVDGAAPDALVDTTVTDSGGGVDSAGGADTGGVMDTATTDTATADAPKGDASVGAPKSQADCPIGRGPKMTFLASPKPYCIDQTEVTDAQLNVFLLASDKPGAPVIPPYCVGKLSLALRLSTSLPAVEVRWCQAYAYCKWAGKRLCGKHGGGSTATDASSSSQWSYACRGGDPGSVFPYGDTYASGTCVGGESTFTHVEPVDDTRYASCHGAGGFATLMHLAGNAREWEDSCDNSGPIDEFTSCATRGGAWSSPWNEVSCGGVMRNITNADSTVGFRCCYDGT